MVSTAAAALSLLSHRNNLTPIPRQRTENRAQPPFQKIIIPMNYSVEKANLGVFGQQGPSLMGLSGGTRSCL